MRGLAQVLGHPRHAAASVVVIPVTLALSARREVAQCQELVPLAPVELVLSGRHKVRDPTIGAKPEVPARIYGDGENTICGQAVGRSIVMP